ncbi:MAG: ribose-phosphate pyrophosphokinase [Bacteroidia bacterium]|nr:ribose-phosphate pyrophosphokinase [Bacteroidia bacterium]
MNPPVKLFAGNSSQALADKIATAYGQPLGKVSFLRFSDGEFEPSFEETVRGCSVFLIQSTQPPVEHFFELLLMADAAKRASAKQVIAVIPYFGFARQDRKDKPRTAIGSKLMANLLVASGITRVLTMDLHADQIQGFFDVPVDHLFASYLFIPYIQSLKLPNLTIASPDVGGSKRANAYATFLKSEIVICYKQRQKANVVDKMTAIGDVEGKDIIILDDIVDTAGTLSKAANMMVDMGANSVRACCTHAVLSGKAYESIEKSGLKELVVTDSIPLKEKSSKIKVLSVAPLFADVINKINNFESISANFVF